MKQILSFFVFVALLSLFAVPAIEATYTINMSSRNYSARDVGGATQLISKDMSTQLYEADGAASNKIAWPLNISGASGDPTFLSKCNITASSIQANDFFVVQNGTSLLLNETLDTGGNDTSDVGGLTGRLWFNSSINWTGRADASDWVVCAYCSNLTGNAAAPGNHVVNNTANATCRTVILDGGVPTAPTGLTTESGEIGVSLTSTVVNNGTTNCTAYITENSATTTRYTMSKNQNSTTCSLGPLSTLSATNTYTYFVEASDGTNKTNSTQTTLTLTQDSSVSGVATAYLQQQATQQQAATQAQAAQAAAATSARNTTIGIVAGLAVLYFVLRKKR